MAERILIEEPSDNRGAVLRHETDGAVFREDILIRRDEGVPKLLAAAQVSDVCQGWSQAGTSIADAVAIEALAALDQSAAVCHCGARAGVLRGAVAGGGNDGHHARDGRNSRDGRPPRKYARYRGCNWHRASRIASSFQLPASSGPGVSLGIAKVEATIFQTSGRSLQRALPRAARVATGRRNRCQQSKLEAGSRKLAALTASRRRRHRSAVCPRDRCPPRSCTGPYSRDPARGT